MEIITERIKSELNHYFLDYMKTGDVNTFIIFLKSHSIDIPKFSEIITNIWRNFVISELMKNGDNKNSVIDQRLASFAQEVDNLGMKELAFELNNYLSIKAIIDGHIDKLRQNLNLITDDVKNNENIPIAVLNKIKGLIKNARKQSIGNIVKKKIIFRPDQEKILNEYGDLENTDIEITSKVESANLICKYLAYKHKWFHGEKVCLNLESNNYPQDKVEKIFELAKIWSTLQYIYTQNALYPIHITEEEVDHDHFAQKTAMVFNCKMGEHNRLLSLVEHDRLLDIGQTFQIRHIEYTKKFGLHNLWVFEKGLCLHFIEERMLIDTQKKHRELCDMTLEELVSGYCAIQDYASSSSQDIPIKKIQPNKLMPFLGKLNFPLELLDNLINCLLYSKKSRDLFDSPILLGKDGHHWISPSIIKCSNPFQAVMSICSSKNVELQSKGKSFETELLNFLKEHDIKAVGFSKKYNHEEYEFDAVALFDKTILVIECKNRSLPDLNPISCWRTEKDLDEACAQVTRLANFLASNRAIISEYFGPEAENYPIISCVMRSLPFSRAIHRGVYVYDFIALKRFFTGSEVEIIESNSSKNEVVAKLWEGQKPTITDLLLQFKFPIQQLTGMYHYRSRLSIVPTDGDRLIGHYYYSRVNSDHNYTAEILRKYSAHIENERIKLPHLRPDTPG